MVRFTLILLAASFFYQCGSSDARPNQAYSESIHNLVKQMTLEEKVHMLHGNGKFTSAGVDRLGIPELRSADGPLGIREELQRHSWAPAGWTTDSATFFPAGGGLSSTWNIELAKRYGEAIGQEARAREKDVLLAPAVNIIRSPLGGRNFEYFTEDPFLNKKLTVPYIVGVQEQGVAACIKHYAINNQETNRGTVNVKADERTIREIYLPVFQAAVEEANVYAVMSAYNQFRGAYLSENDYMLNQLLREEWGFNGLVMSDWGAVHSTRESALYGLDIEMGTENGNYDAWYFSRALIEAVKSGEVPEEVIDEKVRRILWVMTAIGALDEDRQTGSINTQEHSKVAYDVAAESIILLKNENAILPIQKEKVKSIAVIGDNATRKHASGGFGAGVKAQYEVSPLEGLQSRLSGVQIRFARGYKEQYLPNTLNRNWGLPVDYNADQELVKEAVEAARRSDVAVVFAGSNRLVETEAEDRKTLRLPYGQEELIKAVKSANPNTVVVVIAGSPHDLSEIDPVVDGILWSWFNGSEAGNALADILLGTVNPSGKLPVTFPAQLDDSPAHATNSFPGDSLEVVYEEGILVGYRWFDEKGIEPFYPFGYGLSYTTFEIPALETGADTYTPADTISVRVKVKNTGKVSGKETVQLYVSAVNPSVQRAPKELKGFSKVFLNSGEETDMVILLPVKELAYYDVQKGWTVEPGEYELQIGGSSRDIHKVKKVSIR